APLLRIETARDEARGKWYALIVLHHIIDDNVSFRRMLREIGAQIAGRAHELLRPMAYREYVAQALARAGRGDGEVFFHRELGSIREPTAPFGLLNVHGDGTETAEARKGVEAELASRIRGCARRLGVSAATLFHVAYALVVARASARDEVVFGSVLSGRLQGTVGADRALGMFINTLPIRIALQGRTIREVVESTRELLGELVKHEQLSLTQAQRMSAMDGSVPLFSAVLNYRHNDTGLEKREEEGRGIRVVAVHERTNYPFAVSVDDFGTRFALSALTDRRVDPNRVTGYVHKAMESLVQALEEEPETPALQISVLPEAEREQLLRGFNITDEARPQETLVHELFEAQARRTPQAIAVVAARDACTYEQLNRYSTRLAQVLVSQGARPGEVIAIRLSLRIELATAVLAALKAGCGYALIDTSKSLQRQSWMVRHSAASLVIEERAAPVLPLLGAGVRRLRVEDLLSPLASARALDRKAHARGIAALSWSGVTDRALSFEHRSLLGCGSDEASRVLGRLKGLDAVSISLWGSLLSGQALDLLDMGAAEPAGMVSQQLLSARRADQLYVMRNYELVPIGAEGELWVGGGIAGHLCADARVSAARWMPHPFSKTPGERLFSTGVKARLHTDGSLEIVSRPADAVQPIGLDRIEERLRGQARISDVAVERAEYFGAPGKIAAYCVFEGEEDELRAAAFACLRSGPHPCGLPGAIIRVPVIPRLGNGRIDFSKLPSAYGAAREEDFEWPVGACEELLAGIWSELLACGRVSRRANFFRLGGHSLLGMRLIGRIREAFGVELPLRAVFECENLKAQALLIETSQPGVSLPAIGTAVRSEPLPLSFAQQRLWFIDQLEGAGAAYHITGSVRLHGVLDKAALQRALDSIVERHEVLRTTFRLEQGRPIQVIGPAGPFALQERDLRPAEGGAEGWDANPGQGAARVAWEADIAAAVAREAGEETSERFDLTTGPLIRGRLLQLADDEHVLLVTMHHIVSDGWSIGILLRELSLLYAAYRDGQESPLTPLPIQYADYALWQRRWLQGDVLKGQLEYWQKHLEGAPELLQLPTDRARPLVQRYRGGEVAFGLGASLTRELKEVSQQQGTTLFMTLYAGFALLLSKLSAQQDLVIGTGIANRQHTEVDELIGFFVNTLALRARLADEMRVSDLL
ncbi:MAG TPA: condensation domain-containing protein, partial [Steroidobacteraceae bacterium]